MMKVISLMFINKLLFIKIIADKENKSIHHLFNVIDLKLKIGWVKLIIQNYFVLKNN
jgi:hypothetical protein